MATLPGALVADFPDVGSDKGRFVVYVGALVGPSGPSDITYKMSAVRTGDGVRIYWTSSVASLLDAPGGSGLYTSSTLIEEGSWS